MKVLTALLMAVIVACTGCEEEAELTPLPNTTMMGTGAGMAMPVRPILTVGQKFPDLRSAGWLNGDPPKFSPDQKNLIVVDIWGSWCVGVRDSATGLVQLAGEYADRGVTFVSLTSQPRNAVEAHVADYQIPWPQGYGAEVAFINECGAWNAGMSMTPGYESNPTLYIVRGDGQILWTDDRQRTKHEDTQVLFDMLRSALDSLLDPDSTKTQPAGPEPAGPEPAGPESVN